jgi:hypothetical protein
MCRGVSEIYEQETPHYEFTVRKDWIKPQAIHAENWNYVPPSNTVF